MTSANQIRPSARERDMPFRVMVVDDSAAVRGFFRRTLEADAEIEIAASVGNGQAALEALRRHAADVILLDIQMPILDGLSAIPKLLGIDPTVRIVMVSALTVANADVSLQALEAGAADYIAKPAAKARQDASAFRDELIGKVKALARSRRGLPAVPAAPLSGAAQAGVDSTAIALRPASALAPSVLAIGASTGGPQALLKVIGGLGPDFSLPVLVTQHMPAAFTGILAAHIAKAADREAGEAEDGEPVRPGRVYIAPGDFHMVVETVAGGPPVLRLDRSAPENFCRPSVDPMLRSAAAAWGPRLVAAILTGMGHDGLAGARAAVEAGGTVFAQDEATSVVWGMPGAVAAAGLCSAVVPLDAVPAAIRRLSGREAA